MANRRRFTPDSKIQVVLELISGAKSPAEACREYRLNPQMVSKWKAEFLEKAPQLFRTKEQNSAEEDRIAELERMVGRLTLELEMSKKASGIPSAVSGRG